MSDSPPPADRPPLSERDASFQVALAGIEARQAAAEAGASPRTLRALTRAAQAQAQALPPIAPPGSRKLRGLVMRGEDLLVSLCLMLCGQVLGRDPRNTLAQAGRSGSPGTTPDTMEAIAALAFIYCQTDTAWDLLDRAADVEAPEETREAWKRDFRRLALDFAGTFTAAEIETVGAHVIDLARLAAQPDNAEDPPGNAQPPVAP